MWAFRGTITKIGPFVGSRFGNRGAKYFPSKFLAPLEDSKFNIDYDFSIKHEPIQSND